MSDIQSTLNTRESSHGSFIDNSRVMQALKMECRDTINWRNLKPHQREAIDMICHKLGRILTGDPNHVDHWLDIAGYATLVQNILETGKSHLGEN